MEFKDRLRQLRTEKGISITKLAAIYNKTEGAIRAWERGDAKPDVDTLLKLADQFEVPTDYLLGKCEAKNPYNEATVRLVGLTDEAIGSLAYFRSAPIDSRVHGTLLGILNKILPMVDFHLFLVHLGMLSSPNIDDFEEKTIEGFTIPVRFMEEYSLRQNLETIIENLKGGASNAPQDNT